MSATTGPEPVDLDSCAREPIHIPGAIQPHGVLAHLDAETFEILQISTTAEAWLGRPAAALVGTNLADVLDADGVAAVRAQVARARELDPNPLPVGVVAAGDTPFHAIAHRHHGAVILELEAHRPDAVAELNALYQRVHRALGVLHAADSVRAVASGVAEEVRALTGFDRVMVYRFDGDWAGDVIAEAKRDDLESFLGLHYPASDIPEQARRLYELNWIRVIPTIDYDPAPLVPALRPDTGEPLDLSFAVLRSVSPIHLRYLANMGSGATMTISLKDGDRLWGMIACHHTAALELPHPIRVASELLGQVVSLHATTKEDQEEADERVRIGAVTSRLIERMTHGDEPLPGSLVDGTPTLLDAIDATACVVRVAGETRVLGELGGADPDELLDALVEATAQRADDVVATHALKRDLPTVAERAGDAAGLLAAPISRSGSDAIVWVRPEVVTTVSWGGDPNKAVERDSEDNERLVPRGSFAEWKETVRDTSAHWLDPEVKAAGELRDAVRGVVLRHAAELAELNDELARSNRELDAFAHIASHDLREPLRGLSNYATYLKEDYAELLDRDGVDKLDTLVRLTIRMEDLIESLLRYSQVGRSDLLWEEVDLAALAHEVVDLYGPRMQEAGVVAEVGAMATVRCDRVRIGEVFNNLVSNAIKYRDPDTTTGHIWIGMHDAVAPGDAEPSSAVFVRDDGIGIRPRHQQVVFRIFKRLHARDRYGGGTGSGLTLAEKIVERHGGRIWVQSEPGAGSTFSFTIGQGAP